MLTFDPISLSPAEFEKAVKAILDGSGVALKDYKSEHLASLTGVDGDYIIDVAVTFSALGGDYLVLIECKHEKRRTERQDVQILYAKLHSLGAHKGMLFSTAGFQEGAVQFAELHGIALVQIAKGETTYYSRSVEPGEGTPSWPDMPQYVGWWRHGKHLSVLSPSNGDYTREALSLNDAIHKQVAPRTD
jgi:restriction system protein